MAIHRQTRPSCFGEKSGTTTITLDMLSVDKKMAVVAVIPRGRLMATCVLDVCLVWANACMWSDDRKHLSLLCCYDRSRRRKFYPCRGRSFAFVFLMKLFEYSSTQRRPGGAAEP